MAHAKSYTTENIRNLAVIGHGGSGKTGLIDALAFTSGSSKRHGKVSEGVALTWFRQEEKERETSLYCTPAHAEWEGKKINLLDTPGYLDFFGETVAGIRVADCGLIAVGASHGVEVGTELVWSHCAARGITSVFVVTMMDKENANFESALSSIQTSLTEKAVAVQLPIGAGETFKGVVDLLSGKAHLYKAGTVNGEYDESDVPGDIADAVEEARTNLLETIATADEALMDRYLEGEEISNEELLAAFRKMVVGKELYPVFCVAAESTWGCRELLTGINALAPNPAEVESEVAKKGDEDVALKIDDGEPLAALVFKTTSESHAGELSLFKIVAGMVENGTEVVNSNGGNEKLAHLSIPQGKERFEVDELHSGDIGVVARLKSTHTGNSLCDKKRVVKVAPPAFPKPMARMAIHAESRNDEDKIGPGLAKLHEEDPCFTHEYDGESAETVISGLGELHLDVTLGKLKERFGVAVVTSAPKVHYRETIRKEAKAQGRHKKQSGGRGQFGDCHIVMRPTPRNAGYKFNDKIVGGSIPGKFIPAVDKGIQEASARGALAGFPMVDFEVDLVDGSYHAVDSSEQAFKVAGSLGFKKAAQAAAPVLLEPVIKVTVTVPSTCTGDVMGDITQRRGKVLGMDAQGDKTVIEAVVPEAELYRYSTTLRSMSQGRGHHTRELLGLEEVPANIAEKLIAEREKEKEEE
ncbi:MAG: elongation factor G [Deltaproteobacteria bacterium]|nr:elongation factor G [Deltaproteobacteria bacterium]